MINIFGVVSVVLTFALIILVHEFGHFLFAKLLGFRVEEFAIGFGKKLWSIKKGETVYSIRAIPLGGFNNLPEIDAMDAKITWSFYWRRFIILAAGGVFNIVSAIIGLFMLFYAVGYDAPTSTIKEVIADKPAYNVLLPQDKILKINNQEYQSIANSQFIKESKDLEIEVERNGSPMTLHIHKNVNDSLGIKFVTEHQTLNAEKSLVATKVILEKFGDMMGEFFTTVKSAPASESITSLSGPIGVTTSMYQTRESMGFMGLGFMAAFISLQIGIFNLFPIPLLDGGRIVVDTIQLLTKNSLNNKGIAIIQYSGLAIIGFIFLCGTGSDIYRLIK